MSALTRGGQSRKQAVDEPLSSRVVSRPVPESQTRDARGFQLDQLRRRFSPQEQAAQDGSTWLVFKLVPSDPDFPFELPHLDCQLRVPQDYPGQETTQETTLHVRNKDMPRGFAMNIERGWQQLSQERRGASLLDLVKALDRRLQDLLSRQKIETVKLVAFRSRPDRHDGGESSQQAPLQATQEHVAPEQKPKRPSPHVPREWSKAQVAEAKALRAQQVRQLEARMGRMPRFRRSADDIVFTIPLEPKNRHQLPAGLRSVNSVHIIVPVLYPLQDLRVQLNEADAAEAEPVEELFAQRAAQHKHMSLTSHINFLAQSLVSLHKQAQCTAHDEAQAEAGGQDASGQGQGSLQIKSHVQVVARPPDWRVDQDGSESDETSGSEDGATGLPAEVPDAVPDALQGSAADELPRGTMVSMPGIELRGIEALQITRLSLSVRCERCKSTNDLAGLSPGAPDTTTCTKCATQLTGRFDQRIMHAHSSTAGFVHLSGCRAADVLPSTLVPTCERCSTPAQGLVCVRGDSIANVCRQCHARFGLSIPEVRLLAVSAGSLPPPPPTSGPRRTERLGLHAGEPLPSHGVCAHYRRSHRWFRFSCCSRVHACDRCHDAAENHVNEWANRMICGWCSREQPYALDACAFCGRSVIGRRGKGFWEGGKGTRDPRMMSRKDARKYKRINKKP
ncbi:hypothetical protein CDD82_553 [Ophiocordyceps australis]|uniref:CHY-type domain-containing protein n=1 Tax=Ophiocordyceps australis TaxID=1399860 RepID=A0A2C5ZNE3_9HYPO|nr:hypothetical protein CDD82_553 [Ophiocordyceps australis]